MLDVHNLKLLKGPAKEPALKLSRILSALPPIPPAFDCDSAFGFPVPTLMFANDTYGDCVQHHRPGRAD